MKQKKKTLYIVISIILAMLIVGGAFYYFVLYESEKPVIGIKNYYDIDGNVIRATKQSVVDGVEGVAFIDLEINAHNIDTIPLDFTVTSTSPVEFTNALTSPAVETVDPDGYGTWTSDLIAVAPFEGTTVDFSVIITGDSPLRQPSSIPGTVSVQVATDPFANFEVTLVRTTS